MSLVCPGTPFSSSSLRCSEAVFARTVGGCCVWLFCLACGAKEKQFGWVCEWLRFFFFFFVCVSLCVGLAPSWGRPRRAQGRSATCAPTASVVPRLFSRGPAALHDGPRHPMAQPGTSQRGPGRGVEEGGAPRRAAPSPCPELQRFLPLVHAAMERKGVTAVMAATDSWAQNVARDLPRK